MRGISPLLFRPAKADSINQLCLSRPNVYTSIHYSMNTAKSACPGTTSGRLGTKDGAKSRLYMYVKQSWHSVRLTLRYERCYLHLSSTKWTKWNTHSPSTALCCSSLLR